MKEAEEVEQDVASDMLLALQNRTSISRDHPRQNSSAFPETSPPAPAHGPPREEDDESDEHAPTSAEEHDADTALTMDEDDLELKAAQTLSGLAQMEAQKLAAEKKERKNFTKETVDELKRWFASHLDHPYPDEDDKEELARQTGLNVAQVSYWFVNARKRIWQPLLHEKHAGMLTGYAKVTAADMLRGASMISAPPAASASADVRSGAGIHSNTFKQRPDAPQSRQTSNFAVSPLSVDDAVVMLSSGKVFDKPRASNWVDKVSDQPRASNWVDKTDMMLAASAALGRHETGVAWPGAPLSAKAALATNSSSGTSDRAEEGGGKKRVRGRDRETVGESQVQGSRGASKRQMRQKEAIVT